MLFASSKKPLYTPVDNIVDTRSGRGNTRWRLALLESSLEKSEKVGHVIAAPQQMSSHDPSARKRTAQGATETPKFLSTCNTVFLWICA